MNDASGCGVLALTHAASPAAHRSTSSASPAGNPGVPVAGVTQALAAGKYRQGPTSPPKSWKIVARAAGVKKFGWAAQTEAGENGFVAAGLPGGGWVVVVVVVGALVVVVVGALVVVVLDELVVVVDDELAVLAAKAARTGPLPPASASPSAAAPTITAESPARATLGRERATLRR